MIETPTQAIRVVLIEDHAVVRAGLRLLIESAAGFEVVGEAATHADALALAAREQPDIILLDLALGPENGLDLLPKLLTVAGPARVLILTGLSDVEEYREAILRGATGLMLKEQTPEVLLKAIEKVHAGEVWLDSCMLASVLGELVSGRARPPKTKATRVATLTERERDVIALIGKGLKNKQIGERLGISENTVRHHLTSIFDKLGVESRLELIIFAQQHDLTKRRR